MKNIEESGLVIKIKNKNILLIEDETFLRDILRRYLESQEYKVFEAGSGEEGLEILEKKEIDLVVLDIMLPKIQGWEVCEIIKEKYLIPVVILTARGEEDDEVRGLEIGADDYIVKPFKPKVLIARINGLLKKTSNRNFEKVGDIEIDREGYRVLKNGIDVNLGLKGYNLLNFLILNRNIVLSREKILDNVWPDEFDVDARTVDTWIKILRKKIGEEYIRTVRGVGYEFKDKK